MDRGFWELPRPLRNAGEFFVASSSRHLPAGTSGYTYVRSFCRGYGEPRVMVPVADLCTVRVSRTLLRHGTRTGSLTPPAPPRDRTCYELLIDAYGAWHVRKCTESGVTYLGPLPAA